MNDRMIVRVATAVTAFGLVTTLSFEIVHEDHQLGADPAMLAMPLPLGHDPHPLHAHEESSARTSLMAFSATGVTNTYYAQTPPRL